MVTTMYDAESVLSSALMTAGMTVALTIYAFTTKTDFTVCGGLFFVMSIAMLFLVLISNTILYRLFINIIRIVYIFYYVTVCKI